MERRKHLIQRKRRRRNVILSVLILIILCTIFFAIKLFCTEYTALEIILIMLVTVVGLTVCYFMVDLNNKLKAKGKYFRYYDNEYNKDNDN